MSTEVHISERIGVTAHVWTQCRIPWNSPLQRTGGPTHTPRKYTRMLSLLQSHTHTHTRHPQAHFPISSAWRSTCQLPVAEKDGVCWFCEAHRQDPPGDCRSPAAQTSALFTSLHKQSVFYTASLYQHSMHYRTAIEQEIKLEDRYLAEENEPVWSSLTTCTTRTIKYRMYFLINFFLHTLCCSHQPAVIFLISSLFFFPCSPPQFPSHHLPVLLSSCCICRVYETKHPNGCLNSLRYVSLGTISLWQGTLGGNWDHYKWKIGGIFLPFLLCLFIFLSWNPPSFFCLFSLIISQQTQMENRGLVFRELADVEFLFSVLLTFIPLLISLLFLSWQDNLAKKKKKILLHYWHLFKLLIKHT